MTDIEELENKIDELRRIISIKNNRISDLERESSKERERAESAEYKIRTELDPRIENEKRSYDSWATSSTRGMSEEDAECLHFCECNMCNAEDCPQFGDRPECTENMTKKELLSSYRVNDNIGDILIENGLRFHKIFIDFSIKMSDIGSHFKSIWKIIIR